MESYTDVDAYLRASQQWPEELAVARSVLLSAGLTEAIKWGKPCYLHEDRNIAILQEMKDFLALMFFKGALLTDPDGLLREQGPNSRSAKRVEFRSVGDVRDMAAAVTALVAEAIAVEDAGLSVDPAPVPELVGELVDRLDADEAFRVAFEALTPGRRREYNLHFADAKQPKTRVARIDKCAPAILAGKGLRDR